MFATLAAAVVVLCAGTQRVAALAALSVSLEERAAPSRNPNFPKTDDGNLLRILPVAQPQDTHQQSPNERIKFINNVRDSRQSGANARIIPLLSDENADVRVAAANALANLNGSNDPQSNPAGNLQAVLAALRNTFKDPSPEVRAAAVTAFGKIWPNKDGKSIAAALKDPDATVILAAEKALANIPTDAAVPRLTEIWSNARGPWELRAQAVITLGRICNPDSILTFLAVLQDPNQMESYEATSDGLVCALKKRPEKSMFQPILRIFQAVPSIEDDDAGSPDMVLKATLMEAMAATKNPDAFDVLVAQANSANSATRSDAVESLELLGDRRAIPLFLRLLNSDPQPLVRSGAATALTHFPHVFSLPELVAALNDKDLSVQIAALEALLASHDPKAIEALGATMPSDPGLIRLLGESHDKRVVAALIAYLQNPRNSPDSRATAAASLGELGDVRAVEPLISNLTDHDAQVVMQVSVALVMLKDKRAIEPLKRAYVLWSTGRLQNATGVKFSISTALQELRATPNPAGTH